MKLTHCRPVPSKLVSTFTLSIRMFETQGNVQYCKSKLFRIIYQTCQKFHVNPLCMNKVYRSFFTLFHFSSLITERQPVTRYSFCRKWPTNNVLNERGETQNCQSNFKTGRSTGRGECNSPPKKNKGNENQGSSAIFAASFLATNIPPYYIG